MGLTTPPYKTNYVTETTTIETTTRGPIADLSQPGSMTTPAESLPQEGRCATDSLLGPKTKISIGTWNVRTMNEASKLAHPRDEKIQTGHPRGQRVSMDWVRATGDP